MHKRGLLVFVAAGAMVVAGCLSDVVPLHQGGVTPPGSDGGGQMQAVQDSGSGPADGGGGVPDGSIAPPADGGAPLDMTDCIPKSTQTLDGHHNAGLDCMTCHDGNQAAAPKFYVGGTLYDGNGNGLAQATIHMIDANGNPVNLVTASTGAIGNFYTEQPVTAPFTMVEASACPATQKMPNSAAGNCNSCHDGVQNPRIHLP